MHSRVDVQSEVNIKIDRELSSVKDTGCSEMKHLGFGVVHARFRDSYRQTVLIGLEGALSRYM